MEAYINIGFDGSEESIAKIVNLHTLIRDSGVGITTCFIDNRPWWEYIDEEEVPY